MNVPRGEAVEAVKTRDEVVAALEGRGIRRDLAVQYADAFCEYQQATANIREHGAIVQHPRTGNPIPNPYIPVRDRALTRLQKMRLAEAAFLW
jgi:phage terminase small subunit